MNTTLAHTLIVITGLVSAAFAFACSGDESPADAPSTGSRALALSVASSVDEDPSDDRVTFSDDRGQTYTLTNARFVLRHIELDLPDGVGCAEVRDALVGATCGSDDDDNDDDSDDDSNDDSDDDSNDDSNDDDSNDDDHNSSDDDKIRIDGPFVVDLLASTTTPSLAEVRVPDLAYRRVDLRVDDADDDLGLAEGDPLEDLSFLLSAEFEQDGQRYTLDAALEFNEDIRFETQGGVRTADSPLLIAFDAASWFEGLPVGECLEDGDLSLDGDTITLSDDAAEGECSDIENTLKDNLKNSGQLDR